MVLGTCSYDRIIASISPGVLIGAMVGENIHSLVSESSLRIRNT